MSSFDKEKTKPYFERWESIAPEIEKLYEDKDKQAIGLMLQAISNYEELLAYGGIVKNPKTDKEEYLLLPLNGIERLIFIKERIQSHYAYVQLNMLYAEMKKKVARLAIMNIQAKSKE